VTTFTQNLALTVHYQTTHCHIPDTAVVMVSIIFFFTVLRTAIVSILQTRILLSLWDPGLVEEALSFVEEHKVSQPIPEDPVDCEDGLRSLERRHQHTLSPYRRITQQLNFNLKSPDIDDLVTPDSPHCTRTFWSLPANGMVHKVADADTASITALKSCGSRSRDSLSDSEKQFQIFPDNEEGSNHNARDKNEDHGALSFRQSSQDVMAHCNNVLDVDDGSVRMSNGFDCDIGRRFLDTQAMCSSPSANYYKPTDEPEPWDLTQLNIEASVMCLVSKVKFLCGRCGSPAVRLRSSQRGMGRSRSFRGGLSSQATVGEGSGQPSVVTVQPTSTKSTNSGDLIEKNTTGKMDDVAQRLGTFGLTADMSSDDMIDKAVSTVQKAVNGAVGRNGSTVRNKFTEGLDFASIVDWTCELRPSMRKLRQAMDGLLKTARLTHSVFRVQEDGRAAQRACNVRYRRDVCFAQAVSSRKSCTVTSVCVCLAGRKIPEYDPFGMSRMLEWQTHKVHHVRKRLYPFFYFFF